MEQLDLFEDLSESANDPFFELVRRGMPKMQVRLEGAIIRQDGTRVPFVATSDTPQEV